MASQYTFTHTNDFKRSGVRSVGFLEEDGSQDLNAKSEYEALSQKGAWAIRTRVDHWVDGNNVPPRYFHGWNTDGYRECFVFKKDEDRFYGFKCHPMPRTKAGFEMCVLTFHDSKFEEDSNYTLLDRINILRKHPSVIAAIRKKYPEFLGG